MEPVYWKRTGAAEERALKLIEARKEPLFKSTIRILVCGLFHLGVVASLLLSFAQAPFQHMHAGDPRHEHAQGFPHTHWKDHREDGHSWEADNHDSDARMLDWLAGDGTAPAKFVAALAESVGQVVLAANVVRIPELTPHNHDPPWRLTPNLRGPPA